MLYPQDQGGVEVEVYIHHLHLRHSPGGLFDLRWLNRGLLCLWGSGLWVVVARAAGYQDNRGGEPQQGSQLPSYYAKTEPQSVRNRSSPPGKTVTVLRKRTTQPCRASAFRTIHLRCSLPAR